MNTETKSDPTQKLSRITREVFDRMAHSYTRLQELNEMAIKTPNHEAEAKGIVEFLAETFLAHAPEFLGTWTVVRDEYEPLVIAISRSFDRVHGISFARQMRQQKAASVAEVAPAPANVTPLIQP